MRGTVGPAFVQHGELAVFAAEIVAPLRHAMRLVDGEQRDRAAIEQRQEARRQQALGRDVEQVELAGQQFALDPGRGFAVEGGIEEFGAHAQLAQRLDLVLHQRDQRRDHDAARPRAAAPGSGSTATCRRRWASAPAHRRRRSTCSMIAPVRPRKTAWPKTRCSSAWADSDIRYSNRRVSGQAVGELQHALSGHALSGKDHRVER